MRAAEWAIEEFGGAALGDLRRTDRLVELASVLGERPAASLPEACGDGAQLKAAYRLLENEAVQPAAMLASHVQQTLERLEGVPRVLAVQDTTTLDYSHHPATRDLGYIGDGYGYGYGLLVHSTLAVAPDGVPVGLLAQEDWVREAGSKGKKHQRKQRPIGEKESQKWLTGLARLNALAVQCPQTQFVSVADREADVFELFGAERAPNVDLLVRASYDRRVDAAVGHLRASLAAQPVGSTRQVVVQRQDGRPARTATLQVRWQQLTFPAPKRRAGSTLTPVTLWVLWAHEDQPPPDVAPLDWLLLTTLPLPDGAAAAGLLDDYACRWVIERWHFVLKSGCALEARQLERRAALQRALALFSVIAWKVLSATLLARSHPDQPCTVLLAPAEWQALYCAIHKTTTLPASPPTLAQAVRWIAQLGGFIGRTSDGQPGPKVLWRGFQYLSHLVDLYTLFAPQTAHLPAR